MGQENNFRAVPLSIFDSAGLSGTFTALNGTGPTEPLRVMRIMNRSDQDLTLSYGTVVPLVAEDFISAGDTLLLDLQTNNQGIAGKQGTWLASINQVIFGTGTAGTGNIYIIGYI